MTNTGNNNYRDNGKTERPCRHPLHGLVYQIPQCHGTNEMFPVILDVGKHFSPFSCINRATHFVDGFTPF
jgi:hypothetical protein